MYINPKILVRINDISLSLIAILVFLIPMLIILIILIITSEGNPIFWSQRIGLNNNIFKMPKFRTMKINTPIISTDLLENPQYHITKFGFFLRKNSLDELPQFFSVLLGDMSVVGPRPSLPTQINLNLLRQKYKLLNMNKPGITGWAQINGRDNIYIRKKINRRRFSIDT
jgi:O-antigen biosynthesis protein WbqP